MLIIVMKTKTFTVLANQRALPVSRNVEKNLKIVAKIMESTTNYMELSPKFVLLSS